MSDVTGYIGGGGGSWFLSSISSYVIPRAVAA